MKRNEEIERINILLFLHAIPTTKESQHSSLFTWATVYVRCVEKVCWISNKKKHLITAGELTVLASWSIWNTMSRTAYWALVSILCDDNYSFTLQLSFSLLFQHRCVAQNVTLSRIGNADISLSLVTDEHTCGPVQTDIHLIYRHEAKQLTYSDFKMQDHPAKRSGTKFSRRCIAQWNVCNQALLADPSETWNHNDYFVIVAVKNAAMVIFRSCEILLCA